MEGFLDKNRDTLRHDVMGLLIGSRDKVISKMFQDLRNFQEASRTMNGGGGGGGGGGGHLVTMKPRTPTVAARFQDSLHQLLQAVGAAGRGGGGGGGGGVAAASPLYVRCIKPNNDKCPMKFDMPVVLEQIRHTGESRRGQGCQILSIRRREEKKKKKKKSEFCQKRGAPSQGFGIPTLVDKLF